MLAKAVSRLLPKRTLHTDLSPLGAEERAAIDAGLRLLTQADAEIPPYIAKHLVGKDGKVNPRDGALVQGTAYMGAGGALPVGRV